jgi:hypothetical protein
MSRAGNAAVIPDVFMTTLPCKPQVCNGKLDDITSPSILIAVNDGAVLGRRRSTAATPAAHIGRARLNPVELLIGSSYQEHPQVS